MSDHKPAKGVDHPLRRRLTGAPKARQAKTSSKHGARKSTPATKAKAHSAGRPSRSKKSGLSSESLMLAPLVQKGGKMIVQNRSGKVVATYELVPTTLPTRIKASSKEAEQKRKELRRQMAELAAEAGLDIADLVKAQPRVAVGVHAPPLPALGSPQGQSLYQVMSGEIVDPDLLAHNLGLTKGQLASMIGLPGDSLYRRERIKASKTQSRMREVIEILMRVEDWAGGRLQALAWYRGQTIPSLGDQTAEAMVKIDKADLVRSHLDRIADGGYA